MSWLLLHLDNFLHCIRITQLEKSTLKQYIYALFPLRVLPLQGGRLRVFTTYKMFIYFFLYTTQTPCKNFILKLYVVVFLLAQTNL